MFLLLKYTFQQETRARRYGPHEAIDLKAGYSDPARELHQVVAITCSACASTEASTVSAAVDIRDVNVCE